MTYGTATRRIAAARIRGESLLNGWKAFSGSRLGLAVLWGVPLALGLAYAVWLIVRLRDSITALLWNSDYASGFTLAQSVAQFGSGGHTVISTTGAWVALWFGVLTADLPLHRQLWEIAPTLLFIVCVLAIGWAVAQLSSRRSAVYAMAIVFVASPWTLAVVLAPVAHNTVYPATALLGAYLLWLRRQDTRRRLVIAGVPVMGAIVLGVVTASDKLVIVTGVIPLTIAAAAGLIQPSRRARVTAWSALATVIGSVPIAIATTAIMEAAGYVITPPRLALAPLSAVPFHIRLMARGLRDLSNGYLGAGWPGTLHAEVGTACTVVLIAGLVTLLCIGTRSSVRLLQRRRHSDPELTRLLHVAYWFSSAVVVCGAFVLTNAAGNGLSTHESYYLTLIFSVAGIVPLVRCQKAWVRWLVPVGLTIFAVGSIVGLKREYLNVYRPPIAAYASDIVHLAKVNDATAGYAGYWDASNLTWSTREGVVVRPLEQCANPKGAQICPFFLMRSPYWYVPKRRRTFLIVDPSELYVTSVPDGLGKPVAVYPLGRLEMLIYPYDIAARLGPAST